MSFACEPITEEGLPLSHQSPGTTECHESSTDLRDEVQVDERELGGGRGPPRTASGKSSEETKGCCLPGLVLPALVSPAPAARVAPSLSPQGRRRCASMLAWLAARPRGQVNQESRP